MEKKKLLSLLLVGTTLASCGGKSGTIGAEVVENDMEYTVKILTEKPADTASTEDKVAYANSLTMEQLAAASKTEMEGSKTPFKVLGLTSALQKAATQLSKKYDWLHFSTEEGTTADNNVYVNNGYKDAALLEAISSAKNSYVADYVLVQDARSIADLREEGLLYNYYPIDAVELGLDETNKALLEGIHFNKIFWTNTHFSDVSKKRLYNIWQMAGSKEDKDHVNVSFQDAQTEKINMSFLLTAMAPSSQERIESAYESYYGKKWKANETYATAGAQWVYEFLNSITRWHTSDGTAMKESQCEAEEFKKDYVYFGAYSKMKDAAKKKYSNLDLDGNGKIEGDEVSGSAMKTVKWDWEIEGFNGFFYTMYSQIVNKAEHPYTACLFARYILEPEFYTNTIYSSDTPNDDGTKGNQYGYYFPGKMDAFGTKNAKVTTNSYDWTKAKWKEVSLVEKYAFLKDIQPSTVAGIVAEIGKLKN